MRLGAAWVESSNGNYRVWDPLVAMQRRGHQVVWPADVRGEPDLARLAACDVVHVYRRADDLTLGVVAELLRSGVAVTYDNDDDLTLLPRESEDYHRFGGRAARQFFAASVKLARAADAFTTTNEAIAQRYRRGGVLRIEVVDNHLRPGIPRPRQAHDGVVVGWIAGVDHRADVLRVPIENALRGLLERHPQVRVETIGLRLDLPADRYRHDPIVPFDELPLRIGGFDVGIAPLADLPFNRARSAIKVKEYAASGVPWLASPVGPYRDLGDGEGGRLVADDGWLEALERLIVDEAERAALGRAGLAWAAGQTVDAVADRWEAIFAGAAARAAQRSSARSTSRS
jgi:glycosyltransferase involved in cell wall biosynthesis